MSSKGAAPAATSDPGRSPAAATAVAPARGAARRQWPWLVALLFLGAGSAVAAWWQMRVHGPDQARLDEAQQEAARTQARLASELDSMRARLDTLGEQLAAHTKAIAEVAEVKDALATLARRSLTPGTHAPAQSLRLARIEHHVMAAEAQVRLNGDVAGAAAALAEARTLLDAGVPAEATYQRVLTAELAALAAVPAPAVAALAERWVSHAAAVPVLPWRGGGAAAPAPDAAAGTPSPVQGWRGLLGAVWQDLTGLIEIRQVGRADELPGDPALQALLRGALQAEIATLRAALLARDTGAKSSTAAAIRQLTTYFDTAQPAVVAMLADLAVLTELDLSPPLPSLRASLDGLQELRAGLLPSVAPDLASPAAPAADPPLPRSSDADTAPLPASPRDIM